MRARFAPWLISGFLVGLIPVVVNLVIVALTPISVSASALVGRGELLMLSVGLLAGAVADIWRMRSGGRARSFAFLLCLSFIVGTIIVYTVNITALTFEVQVFREAVAVVSLFSYALSVLVSASCIVAVERKGGRP